LTPLLPPQTLGSWKCILTPDQEAFVRQGIASGRFHNETDAVAEALVLWEERERARAEILTAVDAAEASLARGEGREITEQSMRELAEGVKRGGRARLESERASRRCWLFLLVPSLKTSSTTSGFISPPKARAARSPIEWWIRSRSNFLALSTHPYLGRKRDDLRPGLRSLAIGSYVVVYRIEGKDVLIPHVVHGRRDIKTTIRQ
jgi:plasmid stabilization system protein ParE/Arc/MetJ-type ribon-helix-helix transcriptional regulator